MVGESVEVILELLYVNKNVSCSISMNHAKVNCTFITYVTDTLLHNIPCHVQVSRFVSTNNESGNSFNLKCFLNVIANWVNSSYNWNVNIRLFPLHNHQDVPNHIDSVASSNRKMWIELIFIVPQRSSVTEPARINSAASLRGRRWVYVFCVLVCVKYSPHYELLPYEHRIVYSGSYCKMQLCHTKCVLVFLN